jgi:phage anti-repressor protein
MLQRTEKGKQARYFIECENKPRTHLEVQNQKWFIDRE